MSDGSEDLHRLFGDTFPLLRIEVLKRTHVVKTIGQLDEHNANIVNHCQQHLAHILRLLFFTGDIAYLRYLGKTVNQVGDLFSEVLADGIKVNQRVFYYVVQQASGNRHLIKFHAGEDICYFERVNQVRLAGSALLAFMFPGGKKVGAAQQIQIRLRVVTRYVLDNFFNANHLFPRRCFLPGEIRTSDNEYNKKVMPDSKVEHHLVNQSFRLV
jgi:hypothetical protein